MFLESRILLDPEIKEPAAAEPTAAEEAAMEESPSPEFSFGADEDKDTTSIDELLGLGLNKDLVDKDESPAEEPTNEEPKEADAAGSSDSVEQPGAGTEEGEEQEGKASPEADIVAISEDAQPDAEGSAEKEPEFHFTKEQLDALLSSASGQPVAIVDPRVAAIEGLSKEQQEAISKLLPAEHSEAPSQPVQSVQQPPVQQPAKVTPQQWVSDESFNEALSSPAALNTLLNKVHESAAQSGVAAFIEQMTPAMQNMISETVSLHQVVENFYAANPELRGAKNLMYHYAAAIQGDDPNIQLDKIMEQAGAQVRITMRKVVEKQNGVAPENIAPPPAKTTSSRRPSATTKRKVAIEDEIAGLLNLR